MRRARILARILRDCQGAEAADRRDRRHRFRIRKEGDRRRPRERDRDGLQNEWKNPRIFWVQYQGVKGNGLEQFKKLGTQVIVYPEELASGELEFPYSERR